LQYEFEVEIWNQGTIFGLGTAALEALESAVLVYDFGIFVFTPDDEAHVRGQA
jgi:predicted nucleotide-binding protein